jgi:hypothetical protein
MPLPMDADDIGDVPGRMCSAFSRSLRTLCLSFSLNYVPHNFDDTITHAIEFIV